jgi:hypothetical protein
MRLGWLPEVWPHPYRPSIVTSGSREGMSWQQWMTMRWLLTMLEPELVRHGDCVGSDAQVHDMVARAFPQCELHVHPGFSTGHPLRAHRQGHVEHPPARPCARNHQMVNHTDITIATPFEDEPVLRSGTWATIRYSMSINRPTILIKRNGSITVYDGRKVLPMQASVLDLTPTALAADTTGTTAVPFQATPNGWVGFYAQGTWGSGTLKVQQSVDGTTWIDVASASWTANAYKHVQFFARYIRLVLSGSTSPSLKVYAVAQTPAGLPARTDS